MITLQVDCLTGILSDHNAVVRVIAERPQLLACSVEEDWTPLIKYFYFLGIDIFGIRRILACNPAAFCLNIQENIAPKVVSHSNMSLSGAIASNCDVWLLRGYISIELLFVKSWLLASHLGLN